MAGVVRVQQGLQDVNLCSVGDNWNRLVHLELPKVGGHVRVGGALQLLEPGSNRILRHLVNASGLQISNELASILLCSAQCPDPVLPLLKRDPQTKKRPNRDPFFDKIETQ